MSIRSVVKNECVYCKSQLDGTEATKISEDEKGLLAQNMIQLWFEGGNNFGDLAGIPEQSAELLFRIVDGIRFCLMSQRQLWEFFPRLGNLPPLSKGQKLFSHVSFALYSTAFEALTNWPLGFYQFLETYARAGSNRTLHQDLPILYSQWIQYRWKKPEFKFLQTAFDDYVAQYYDPSASVITSTRFRNNEKFIARLGYTTLQTVVNKVGLSKAIVIGLIKEGLIVAEAHPELDNHHQWIINKESVDRFLEDIRCNTFNDRRAEFAVDLKTASKMVASVDLNVVKLITYIATGRLGAVWTSRHLRDLRLNKSEIESLVHSIKQTNGWISRHEVARRIGVKPTIISKWVETGLMQPIASYANAQHFDQKTIDSFVRDHIFSDEAADILGVDVIVVQRWARKGRLKPVVGGDDSISHRYLFRRKDVELLRPENRLTAPQMAKRLGISRSQMFVWIKHGKVKPISGPGIDDCKHYLFVL